MPFVRPPGPYPIEGVSLETWLVRFDEAGVCTSPETRAALLEKIAAKPTTPLLILSHGWNNDFADAVLLYKNFLTHFQKIVADHPLAGPEPLVIGIIWPSMWWPSDPGPKMAAVASAREVEESGALEDAVQELAATLDTAKRARFYELTEAKGLTEPEAHELAQFLKPMLRGSDDGKPEDISDEAFIRSLREMQKALGGSTESDILEEAGTIAGAGGTGQVAAAGWPALLDPRWAVRLATLYVMKDRAGTVGATGASALLHDLLQRTNAPVHAVGHSYGGKLLMSAIATQPAGTKPVKSLLLLEPAVSHLCFAATVPGRAGPGGYRQVLDRVVNPVLTTYSANDFPLHAIYHLALLRRSDLGELKIAAALTPAGNPPNDYAALGGYGPRGAAEHLIAEIPAPGEAIDMAGARIVGLDGSLNKRISSHGDVANPYTAWALRTLMNLGA